MGSFQHELAEVRPDILRFAKMQLRDDCLAEDMVQEALAAAVCKQAQFRGDAGLKTWVIGILKNKIRDYFRSRPVLLSWDDWQEEGAEIDGMHDSQFSANGHWQPGAGPSAWSSVPETFSEQQDFLRTLEHCLAGLPEHTAKIFYLREVMGMEVGEICEDFGLSKDNCYVILHRARNGLRTCLQHRWFDFHE